MAYENIIVETRGRVGLIRLNRPQALNALNRALMSELGQAIAAFEADTNIGCMVITGSEKAFAAGADIKEMADKDFAEAFFGDFCADWHQAAAARKPVVAAVAGFALGGGCELAMQCDLIIAADNAKFGQPEIKLGIIPGIGGTQRLTHAVGKAKAMDLILTGRMMDAVEAERAGLVARVVPAASLLDEAMKLAEAAGLDLQALGRVVRHTDALTSGPGAIMVREDMNDLEPDNFLYQPFLHTRGLGEKDLSLALALGEAVSVDLPLAQLAYQRLAAGLGVPHTEKEA